MSDLNKEYQDAVIFTIGLCQQEGLNIAYGVTSNSQETFHKMLVEHKKPDKETFANLIYSMIMNHLIAFESKEDCIEKIYKLKNRYDKI